MSDGFLARWSRRKLGAKDGGGAPADDPVPARPPAAGSGEAPVPQSDSGTTQPAAQPAPAQPEELPPLTLEDVRALTSESDFSRFAAREVAPEVRNAALKKLFANPRYNVMDGLDVYVGDYSRPDPVTPGLLRQMVGARTLGLFEEPEHTDEPAVRGPGDDADNSADRSVAHCDPAPCAPAQQSRDADPDLRLQQDHADPGADPGSGTG